MSRSRKRRKKRNERKYFESITSDAYNYNQARIERRLEEDPFSAIHLSPWYLRHKRAFRLAKILDQKLNGGQPIFRDRLRSLLKDGNGQRTVVETRSAPSSGTYLIRVKSVDLPKPLKDILKEGGLYDVS